MAFNEEQIKKLAEVMFNAQARRAGNSVLEPWEHLIQQAEKDPFWGVVHESWLVAAKAGLAQLLRPTTTGPIRRYTLVVKQSQRSDRTLDAGFAVASTGDWMKYEDVMAALMDTHCPSQAGFEGAETFPPCGQCLVCQTKGDC